MFWMIKLKYTTRRTTFGGIIRKHCVRFEVESQVERCSGEVWSLSRIWRGSRLSPDKSDYRGWFLYPRISSGPLWLEREGLYCTVHNRSFEGHSIHAWSSLPEQHSVVRTVNLRTYKGIFLYRLYFLRNLELRTMGSEWVIIWSPFIRRSSTLTSVYSASPL